MMGDLFFRTCLRRTGYLPQGELEQENKRTEERFRRREWLEASCGLTTKGDRALLVEANADSQIDVKKINEYEIETRMEINIALGSNAEVYNIVRENSVRQGEIKLYLERVK